MKALFILVAILTGIMASTYTLSPWPTAHLIISAIIVGGSCILLFAQLFSPLRHFYHRLRLLQPLLTVESLEVLQPRYQELYGLYLRLHEHQKAKVYPLLMQLRATLEKQLLAKKTLERISQQQGGSLAQREQRLQQLQENLAFLSQKMREQYAPTLLQLQESIECGTKVTPAAKTI